MAAISLHHVRKAYPKGVVALSDVTFDIDDGQCAVIVGPSGCGKTTVLRLIAGLDRPTDGAVHIGGQPMQGVAPSRRDVAMVFQNSALYPHMTVRRNLLFAPGLRKVPREEIDARVRAASAMLGLDALLDRRPQELSGGERQRAAIGRAIVRRPRVLLLDEPLSNLDARQRTAMRAELHRMYASLGLTTIHVTHDQEEAMALADRLIVMREGHVEQVGSPMEVFASPANRFVGGFIGQPAMSFLDGRVEHGPEGAAFTPAAPGARRIALPTRLGSVEGGLAALGIRRALMTELSDAPDIVCDVELVEQLGDRSNVVVRTGDATVTIRCGPHASAPRSGDRVGLRIEWDHAHIFDEGGSRISAASAPPIADEPIAQTSAGASCRPP